MGSVSLCEDETARKHKIPRWNKALVFEIFGDGRMPKAATVFPQLQTFQVGMMDLDAVPLLKFLHAQPKLSQVDFIAIILSTRREGWGFLIAQLPETVQRWTVYKPAYFHRGKRMELDPARLPRGSGWECVSNESGFAEFRRVPGWRGYLTQLRVCKWTQQLEATCRSIPSSISHLPINSRSSGVQPGWQGTRDQMRAMVTLCL